MLLNTGDRKGKTTAAMGVAVHALAQMWPVCVVQFLKSGSWGAGEKAILRTLGVEWVKGGDGFTWASPRMTASQHAALAT
ncbi:MAG: cob(I)yrinic acid a,c-diamide adenosyltransferase [Actinobacteria bacterium]|nr:cob(I)yrinic acid a,c-diamide adenosyltransferase [Actinomycetota bacterium]